MAVSLNSLWYCSFKSRIHLYRDFTKFTAAANFLFCNNGPKIIHPGIVRRTIASLWFPKHSPDIDVLPVNLIRRFGKVYVHQVGPCLYISEENFCQFSRQFIDIEHVELHRFAEVYGTPSPVSSLERQYSC